MPGETMEEAADRIVKGVLVSVGTPCDFSEGVDWLSDPTPNRYLEWTWQLNRHHDWQILALRYRETGDERYAEAFVRYFRSWIRQAGAPGDGGEAERMCWRTIEAGIRMKASWPYAIHAFYQSPHVTDDDLVDWYKAVWLHGKLLRHDHKDGNWLIMEMNGLAQIGLVCPIFKESDAWRAYGVHQLAEELHNQVYPDGFQYELTTWYHQVIITNYYHLARMFEEYGQELPEEIIQGLERAYEVNVKLMMPNGLLPDVNDGGWVPAAPRMKSGVRLFPDRSDFLWVSSNGSEGEPPKETSVALPYAGYYVMRSGWGQEDIWAFVDAGPYGRSHQHEDKLNVLLFAYGKRLLTEGGNYAYDDSEMRRYVLSTRSHNTVRVDGRDQNRWLHYRWEPGMIHVQSDAKWQSSPSIDFLEGTYSDGYGAECEIAVTHSRQVYFLKEVPEGLSPFFLILDRFQPNDCNDHDYEVLWHPDADSVAVHDGSSVHCSSEGQAGLTLLTAPEKEHSIQIVSGQRYPEWQGWAVTGEGHQGEYKASPAVIYHYRGKGDVCFPTVLYPLKHGEVCPIRTYAVRDQMGEDVSIELWLKDGRNVMIDMSVRE